MDMQGTPIGGNAGGTKNTSDPRAKDPIYEKPGAVASDSLAAESYNSGGGFRDNVDSKPYSQSGSSSTFNTTDTSGATALDAARNASEREQSSTDDTSYASGAGGQGGGAGSDTKLGGYGNTSSSAARDTAGGLGSSGSSGSNGSQSEGQTSATGFGGSGSNAFGSTGESGNYASGSSAAGEAPNYVLSQYQTDSKPPHGKNLTEGGFEGEASGGFAEPGSKDDPSRAALEGFQNASASAPGNTGPRHDRNDENTYSNLESS